MKNDLVRFPDVAPKIYRCLTAVGIAVLLAGCPRGEPADPMNAQYCRLPGSGGGKPWQIHELGIGTLVSGQQQRFEIQAPSIEPANAGTRDKQEPQWNIKATDLLRVQRFENRLLLTITDANEGLKATSIMELDGSLFSKFWASGPAYDEDNVPIGSMYLFRLENRTECSKDSEGKPVPCRRVHVEYYKSDYAHEDHKPRWGHNVVDKGDKRCMNAYGQQTGEGDADEGKNTN